MAEVEPRPATSEDYDFADRVHCAAMRPSAEEIDGWEEERQARCFDEQFEPAGREITRCQSLDVGVLSIQEQDNALFPDLIATLPECQKLGIGTGLVGRLQARAQGRGIPLRLRVLKANRARRPYERLGFVLTGETETHYQMALVAFQCPGDKLSALRHPSLTGSISGSAHAGEPRPVTSVVYERKHARE